MSGTDPIKNVLYDGSLLTEKFKNYLHSTPFAVILCIIRIVSINYVICSQEIDPITNSKVNIYVLLAVLFEKILSHRNMTNE